MRRVPFHLRRVFALAYLAAYSINSVARTEAQKLVHNVEAHELADAIKDAARIVDQSGLRFPFAEAF